MTQSELLHALDELDKQGIWAFRINILKLYFPKDKSLSVLLGRHVKANIIKKVSRGIYANPRAKSTPNFPLEALVSILKPGEQHYLSLESMLSEAGYISQMPNRLTFMTTGRSQTFKTSYGILEFIHSERDPKKFLEQCYYDNEKKIWIASSQKALRDLNRTNRSKDLVNIKGEQLWT